MIQTDSGKRLMVLLEGNIGAGKTTIGRALANSAEFDFIEEPTKMWQEGFASNMLELFYADPKRWGFTFQITAFVTRSKTWHEIAQHTPSQNVILERSVYCDRYVFAENCRRTGLFSEAEYQLYCNMWEFMVGNFTDEPDLIVYLRTPAEECLRRIKNRARTEEEGLPIDYLLQLENLHDEWLRDNPKALVLDGTRRWQPQELTDAVLAATKDSIP